MAQYTIKQTKQKGNTSLATSLRLLLIGTYFGIVLVKSEAVRWERIHKMFLFEEAHLYLVIGTAVIIAALSMFLIRRFQVKTVEGHPITYTPKPFHKGVVIGGTLFGMGWAITGACPGPIYAQIGAGTWPALITFTSALMGMYLYAYLQPKLPH